MRPSKTKTSKVNGRKNQKSASRALVQNWNDLSLLERAKCIARLKQNIKSNRVLAGRLNVDEGTIRRLLRIQALPESDKVSIAASHSAKKVLAAARVKESIAKQAKAREEAEAELKRILLDNAKRAETIQRCTSALLWWLRENELCGPFAERVLLDIQVILQNGPRSQTSALPVTTIIEQCRPKTFQDAGLWMNPLIAWGADWIARAVPSGAIRDDMFKEATKAVLARIELSGS